MSHDGINDPEELFEPKRTELERLKVDAREADRASSRDSCRDSSDDSAPSSVGVWVTEDSGDRSPLSAGLVEPNLVPTEIALRQASIMKKSKMLVDEYGFYRDTLPAEIPMRLFYQ
ncbi:hypothetical protein HK104_002541 [Borealophlyctis nickersoniae]|nr:hypothetical protein HK104_002541 [Borealophlyctis nickersoniae]